MTSDRKAERALRAGSFGSVAASYEEARPGYPLDAIKWLVGASRRVLDLGAGTGKLARLLVEAGYDGVAVEPSQEMLEQLRTVVPQAEALLGPAELIPVSDNNVDAVVAAQAFHWFDAPVALAEIARVLRPKGTFGLVWNIPDPETPWIAQLSPLAGGLPTAPPDPAPALGDVGMFSEPEVRTFRHDQTLARDQMLALAGSWSSFAAAEPDDREARLAAVGDLFDEASTHGEVVMPYVTYAYRTRLI